MGATAKAEEHLHGGSKSICRRIGIYFAIAFVPDLCCEFFASMVTREEAFSVFRKGTAIHQIATSFNTILVPWRHKTKVEFDNFIIRMINNFACFADSFNIIGNASDEYTPMYQTTMSSAQHNFNVGASVGITLGDLFNRPLKLKDYRYQIEQLQYTQEGVMEERRLKVLEAYNAVTEQLATIKAKAETAALYNAQMKISENNFIQGAIDIIALSLERARRTGAVTNYEQSRVALHNSIVLLEMLTNVKVITDK